MSVNVPYMTFGIAPAFEVTENVAQKILFIGQKTNAGTAVSGKLQESIGNANQQDALFGKDSMLAAMIRIAKQANLLTQMDAIGLSDYQTITGAHTQSFAGAGTNFTFNELYTDFSGIRLEQLAQEDLSYVGDVITPPNPSIATVKSYTSFTAVDDGVIHYTLDGQYYNGTAWATSDNTWAKSNTAAVINANITTLTPIGTDIALTIITDTGSVQQWSESVVIDYIISSATNAQGSIVFTDTATTAGTLTVNIGSSVNNSYQLNINVGETITQIGDELVSLITDDATCPVTAVNNLGTVTFTAVNSGTVGNCITIGAKDTVIGTTYTVSGMTGGATDPSLTNLFNAVRNRRYQTIVYPSNYPIATVKTFLDSRFTADGYITDGEAIIYKTDTVENLVTLGNSYNDQVLTIFGDKKIIATNYAGSRIFELDYCKAAYIAAIRALRLTQGADLSQLVIGTSAADYIGGMALASLPYFNTPLTNLAVITDSDYDFQDIEVNQLKAAGISTIGNNQTNNEIVIGEVVTNYKNNAAGNPDKTYKYLEYVDTISNIREFIFNNLKTTYAQSRLTNGDRVRNAANAASIESEIDGLYNLLSSDDYALTQAGEQALQFFKKNRSVTLDLATGTANILMITPIVTQLRAINAVMQIAFSTNS